MPQQPDLDATLSAARIARAGAAFGLAPDYLQRARPVTGSGFSAARLWKLESTKESRCLREWPLDQPPIERLRFMHFVQKTAVERGVWFVPWPFPGPMGDTTWRDPATGRLWEFTTWMSGEPHLEGAISTNKLQAAFAALGQFHDAVFDVTEDGRIRRGPPLPPTRSPGLRQRLEMGDELHYGGLEQLRQLIKKRSPSPFAEAGERACELFDPAWTNVVRHVSEASQIRTRLNPCLRDTHSEHMLFTGEEVTGLIDFGAIRIESPLAAVARLSASYAENDETVWPRTVNSSGFIRSDEDLALVRAFDRSAAALSCFTWLKWVFEEGRTFDEPMRVHDRLDKLLLRLERVATNTDFWMRK